MRTATLSAIFSIVLSGCTQTDSIPPAVEVGHVDASGEPIHAEADRPTPAGDGHSWTFEPDAPEDCFNGIDDDFDNRADCVDTECWDACGCITGPGDRVLWYLGNGAPSTNAQPDFIDTMLSEGASAVEDTTSWPGSLLDYRLVLLLHPTQNMNPGQKADIAEFIAAGGTLVLVGEGAGFTSGHAAVFNDLNATIGTSTTWRTDSIDALCDKTATVVFANDLTAGFGSFIYAYTNDVNLSIGATMLLVGESGQTLVAEENGVVMITDAAPFLSDCNITAGNEQFWRNLYSFGNGLPPADGDLDGVHDTCDYCPGSDDGADADADGEPDACDLCPGFDDSTDANGDGVPDVSIDTDGDGIPDVCDVCPLDNPDDAVGDGDCDSGDACVGFDDTLDADGDGVADGCDPCPTDVIDDSDGDGVCEGVDQCPNFDDAIDGDGDGNPDACDPCPLDPLDDSDLDGICDSDDLCPGFDDTLDGDGDGVPNDCDTCPFDNPDDTDGDGICDTDDLCPNFDDAIDGDGDGKPDNCDPCPLDALDDSDSDGVCDSDDLCPGFPDGNDGDDDGQPNDCDPCPYDNPDDTDGDGVCDRDDICDGDDTIDGDADGEPDDCDMCPADAVNVDSDADGICDGSDTCEGFDDALDSDGDAVADGCDPCPFDNPDDNDDDGICNSDDDTPDGDDEKGGEGCSCDNSTGPVGWLPLLVLALVVRRRA